MRKSFAGNLASIYYEQGQLDLAILHYSQAITCDPQFVEAYNNLVGMKCMTSEILSSPATDALLIWTVIFREML